jgi:hypothetical protein
MAERLSASPQSEPVSPTGAAPQIQTGPDVFLGIPKNPVTILGPNHWVLST